MKCEEKVREYCRQAI